MLRRLSSKRKQNNSAEEDKKKENKKLLSKFLEFITSSMWSIPIASFIEQESIVFDRQQMVTSVYEQIHKDYAQLIDTLIECFCEDIGSTPANLTEAIRMLENENLSVRQRVSLEPLAAAQDYNVFVPMMMRKNVELQLQALQMIEYMCGLIPNVLQLEDGETLRNIKKFSPEDTERYVLISVIRQSQEEFNAMGNGREEMERIARESQHQRELLEHQILREEHLLRKALTATQPNSQGSSTQTDTPISVAGIMIRQIECSTNTDTYHLRPKGELKNMETNTESNGQSSSASSGSQTDARPKSAVRKTSRTAATGTEMATETDPAGISPDEIQLTLTSNEVVDASETTKRPPTAKKTTNSKPPSRGGSEDVVATTENGVRPKTGGKKDGDRPTTGKTNGEKEINGENESSIVSEFEMNGENGARPPTRRSSRIDMEPLPAPSSDVRPPSRKASKDIAAADLVGARPSSRKSSVSRDGRPPSKHTARKESEKIKTDQRPATRRSSVDKMAPQRNDSVPRERRMSMNNKKDTSEYSSKPPKPLPGAKDALPARPPLSPGQEHGPRRKNLDDVHSHLVDADRLNSSDVRSRAEYLRQQRDKLLRMKRDERIKQMNEVTKNNTERPKTAKAARGALEKKEADDIRREISQKLRAEILTLE